MVVFLGWLALVVFIGLVVSGALYGLLDAMNFDGHFFGLASGFFGVALVFVLLAWAGAALIV